MAIGISALVALYSKLIGGVVCGWILARFLPTNTPQKLGHFQYWVGVPLGMVIFLRWADLAGAVWLAPVLAWSVTFTGAAIAWLWLQRAPLAQSQSEGTFILSVMFGNTGYIGYPIALSLVGETYFGWVVFYDLLGTTLGAYGLGAFFANAFSSAPSPLKPGQQFLEIVRNPVWWSFGLGLGLRQVALPDAAEVTLRSLGWTLIMTSLVLIGMRFAQLQAWHHWRSSLVSIVIKMLLVPLVFGLGLKALALVPTLQLTLVLQMAMPPAFATLIISEAYDLDRELAVTVVMLGSLLLLILLPFWLWLFGV
ncbi:MAG: AEC family transporter [Spirulina sp. SIO3F2]|nr:AEC family transporter [Spirulina sp. SIO3F2]